MSSAEHHNPNAGYNNRLQMTSRQILQVSGQPGVSSSYQYYADGQLKFSHSADERFDRAYSYDHAARATEAYSGSEARDYVNGTNSGAPTGAYRQSYQYNALSEVSQQTNRLWSQTRTTINTFVNNRLQGWSYDADGELTHDDTTTYTRDAANRIVAAAGGGSSSAVKYDGDGQMVWRQLTVLTGSPRTQTSYYLRSSVLGLAVAELDTSGQKTKGYVYAGRRKLAEAKGAYVRWSHEDPATGGSGESDSGGSYIPVAEFNADGVNIGFVDPALAGDQDIADPFSHKAYFGFSSGCGTGDCLTCILDGFEHDCGQMSYLFDIGVAGQCPDNNCGPRFSHDRNGKPILVPLTWDPGTGQLGWKDWERRHNDPNGADEDDRIYFGSYFWAPVWHYADAAIFGFLGMGFGFGPPQNTDPNKERTGGFVKCANDAGLGYLINNAAYFANAAANLILKISGAEGTSPELLAVTMMNEGIPGFNMYSIPNTNPNSKGVGNPNPYGWDYGPFGLNGHYVLGEILAGNYNIHGIDLDAAFGNFNGAAGQPFNGNPLENGRIAARKLNWLTNKHGEEKAAGLYTGGSRIAKRMESYRNYAGKFRDFFNCYRNAR